MQWGSGPLPAVWVVRQSQVVDAGLQDHRAAEEAAKLLISLSHV